MLDNDIRHTAKSIIPTVASRDFGVIREWDTESALAISQHMKYSQHHNMQQYCVQMYRIDS